MTFIYEDRSSESSFVQTIWRAQSERAGSFISVAASHWEIERTRYAMTLLQQGASILDTVYQAGYFDQPHLTRALKRFVGQTPAQIAHLSKPE